MADLGYTFQPPILLSAMFSDFSSNIASALAGAADPRRAPAMRAYMRDQFDFLGVPTPRRRLAVRPQLNPPKLRKSCAFE